MDEDQAVAVEIHAGAETRIDFGLLTDHAFRVSGTVTEIPGGAMTQLMLRPRQGGGSEMAPQQLEEGGKFEFTNVLPGSYVASLITVTFEDGRPAVQMLRLGQPIEVNNDNVEGLRLQSEAAGQVRGKFRLDTDQKLDWTLQLVCCNRVRLPEQRHSHLCPNRWFANQLSTPLESPLAKPQCR